MVIGDRKIVLVYFLLFLCPYHKGKKPKDLVETYWYKLKENENSFEEYVLMIQIPTPNDHWQRPAYKDIEAIIGEKTHFPGRNEIYQKLHMEEYVEVIPHNDPEIREFNENVFINIRKSCFHYVIVITLIINCSKYIEWIINHNNLGNNTIIIGDAKCVVSFSIANLEKYYKILKLGVHLANLFDE
jgi:hypothetical protein